MQALRRETTAHRCLSEHNNSEHKSEHYKYEHNNLMTRRYGIEIGQGVQQRHENGVLVTLNYLIYI